MGRDTRDYSACPTPARDSRPHSGEHENRRPGERSDRFRRGFFPPIPKGLGEHKEEEYFPMALVPLLQARKS